MKKIYLITLSLFMANISLLIASNPQNVHNQGGSDERIQVYSGPYVSKANSHVSFSRPPQNSNVTFAGCIFTDNFDGANDTTSLKTRGYIPYYRGSGPQGTAATWFTGTTGTFPAFNGPATGYVASNFNSVTAINNIDNWLVLPVLSVSAGDVFSFYSRAPIAGAPPFVDSLHIYFSAAGDSTPEDTTWVLLGEFEVNSLDMWENNLFTIPSSSATGRLAIRYAVVDGGPQGANSNYIGIDQIDVFTPSLDDIQAWAITAPLSGCGLSATESVTIVVANTGVNPLSNFYATFTVDSGTAVIETIPGPLQPGDTLSYTFTTTADLSAQGTYTIHAGASAMGDSSECNDRVIDIVVSNSITVDPLATPLTMGFEANEDFSLWEIEDANGDGTFWAPINTFTHSGSMTMRKAGSATSDDDWLFTNCLDLTTGTTYHLDYWYKVFDLAAPCNLESFVSTDPNSSAVISLIMQNPIPNDTTYAHAIGTFTVNTAGTYYVAFHALSGAGTSAIRIDDINIDDGTFIGITENKPYDNVSIYPNPNNGSFYVSSKFTSSDLLVEVFNISGQRVFSSSYANLNRQYIDLTDLAKGIYNVRISTNAFVENHVVITN